MIPVHKLSSKSKLQARRSKYYIMANSTDAIAFYCLFCLFCCSLADSSVTSRLASCSRKIWQWRQRQVERMRQRSRPGSALAKLRAAMWSSAKSQ